MMCRHRVSRFLAMFILCWLLLFLYACAPSTNFQIGQFNEVTFIEKQLDSRYRLNQPGLLKTKEMWLSSHERDSKELVFGWRDVRFQLRAPNVESCDSYSSENDQCLECNACSRCGRLSLTDQSAGLIEPAFATLKADEITLHTFHMRHGCLDSPNHPRVEVRDGITYSLTNKALATDKNGFSNALTLKTRIVNSSTTFDLPITKKLAGSTADDVKLHGRVELIGDVLNAEFSNSLKVTQVEVLPGKKNVETGLYEPSMDPKISVQPSRIVWVADFENAGYVDQTRCYFDRNNLNGTFNIFDGCRVDRDRGTLSTLPNLLTPTHLELTSAAGVAPVLTWFVEYNRLDFIAQIPVVEKPTICTTTDREGNCEGIVPILRFTIEQK